MANVSGVVSDIKQFGKAFNLVVDGESYGYGFERPGFGVGTPVSFTFSMNGKWRNVDKGSVKVLDSAPAPKVVNGVGAVKGKDDYWSRKETRDVENDKKREYGATRNSAIAVVDLLLKYEAVKIPAKGDKVEFILALVEDVTSKMQTGNHENLDASLNAGDGESDGGLEDLHDL